MSDRTLPPGSDRVPAKVSRRRKILTVVGVALLLGVGLFLWRAERDLDAQMKQESECCWKSSATPDWVSKEIGVRIPAGATDRRAGYRIGERWDEAILTFSLSDSEARAYVARLMPEGRQMVPKLNPRKYDLPDSFERLGLTDPEALEGVLKSSFCPDNGIDTVEGKRLRTCARFFTYAHAPDKTRIYVRAHFEPGISPPPQ